MKKLFLTLTAFALALTGCGKKKNSVDPNALTPEQQESSKKVNATIVETFKMLGLDMDQAPDAYKSQINGYVSTYSDEAARRGCDGAKIEKYYVEITGKIQDGEFNSPEAVLDYLVAVNEDEGFDDLVYFGFAFGKTYCRVAAMMDPDGQTGKIANAVISYLDKQGDALPVNLAQVGSRLLSTYAAVMDPEFLGQFANLFRDDDTLDPVVLKALVGEVGNLLVGLTSLKSNWTYLKGALLDALTAARPLLTEVREALFVFDLIEETHVLDVVDAVFEVADHFAKKIQRNFSNEYYAHLDEIENPFESYAYAVLGAVEELAEGEEIKEADINSVVSFVLAAASKAIGVFANYPEIGVPEEALAIARLVVNSEHTEGLLKSLLTLLADMSAMRLECVSALSISQIVGHVTTKFAFQPEEREPAIGYSGEEAAVHFSDYSDFFRVLPNAESIFEAIEEDGSYTYSYDYDYYDEDPALALFADEMPEESGYDVIFEFYHIHSYSIGITNGVVNTFSLELSVSRVVSTEDGLQPIIELVVDGLDEIIASPEKYADLAINDLIAVFESAYGLFNEVTDGMELPEEFDQIKAILAIVDLVVTDHAELVCKLAGDVLVVVRDVLDGLVGEEAEINFTILVIVTVFDSWDLAIEVFELPAYIDGQLDDEHLAAVLGDVYELGNAVIEPLLGIDFLTFLAALPEYDGSEDPMFPGLPTDQGVEGFANYFIAAIHAMLRGE